jgi:hypothetical protein
VTTRRGASAATKALAAIERRGIILVYPIANRADVPSLWSELHPRSRMRWDWDATADDRVVELWHLKNELAASGDVAYAKWLGGRATFFSLDVFHAVLAQLAAAGDVFGQLPREALEILELLRERSPLSTKELRSETGLRGKPFESLFTHAMKALWSRLLVVGTGEIEDGAFPSLAVSATELVFEDIWNARTNAPATGARKLAEATATTPAFRRQLARSTQDLRPTAHHRSNDEDL